MSIRFLSRPFTIVLCSLLAGGAAFAQQRDLPRGEDVVDAPAVGEGLCLHNLFQSNMVLQRDKPVVVWGWADPGETVTVTLGGAPQTATAAADRSWKVTFPPMPARAEPLAMTVKGKAKTLTLDNILVGDVWVLGGQSNMEFPISKIENGQLEVVSANFPNIRILSIPTQQSPEPLQGFARLYEWSAWSHRHFRKGDWDVCSPETVRELSAIGYVFARRLSMATQVPIGVIDASRGGTTVETWTPDAALRKIDTEPVKRMLANWDEKVAAFDPKADLEQRKQNYRDRLERLKKDGKEIPPNLTEPTDLRPGPAADHNRPGACYGGMLAPLAGLAVKGVIFHQGFNNCFDGTRGALMYRDVFPKMIAAWRDAFGDPDLPFGILSLCTAGGVQTPDNFLQSMADVGPYIRAAQYQTFLELYRAGDTNIGFVSTFDLRRRWYHPQLKVPAGERIARWALATQYGMDREIKWKPPMIKEMKVEDGRILLVMDESASAVDDGSPIEGFAIAGEDRRFEPADADNLVTGKDSRGRPQKDRSVVVLSSPLVPKPTQFRYAWARSPLGNLQGGRDIPFATQRSDDWMMGEVPFKYPGFEGELTRPIRNEVMRELRLDDTERRLKEAQSFIDEHQEAYEKERAAQKEALEKARAAAQEALEKARTGEQEKN